MKKYTPQFILCFLLLTVHFAGNGQQCMWASTGVCLGGTSNSCLGYAVSPDHLGNMYSVGAFYGDSMVIGSAGIRNTDATGCDIFVVKYDSSGGLIWLKKFGGMNNDLCYHAVSDAIGNLYILGNFQAGIAFGASTFSTVSWHDLFIAKLDPNGNVCWAKHIKGKPGTSPESSGIALDNSGHLFVAGQTDDTLTFDATHTANINLHGMFLSKYDTSGNVQWVTTSNAQQPNHIAADNFGNIFVTGNYQRDTVRFDNIYLAGSFTNYCGFLVKYNGLGSAVWAKSEKCSWSVNVSNLITDVYGNVINSGVYYGSTLNIGSAIFPNPDTNTVDIFIAKFDSSGGALWVGNGTGPGPGDNHPFGIASDGNGNVVVSGRCDTSSITFGTHSVSHTSSFIVEYNGAGSVLRLWKPDTGYLEPVALAIDNTGNLLVAGDTGPPLLKMGAVTVTFPSFSNFGLLVAKFNRSPLEIVQPIKSEQSITLYPSPARNTLIVADDVPVRFITITNYTGQIFYSGGFSSNKIQLDISNLPSGNYLATINGAFYKWFTKL